MKRNYDEMMVDDVFVGFVNETIKANFRVVRKIRNEEIKGFKAADDKLVMMTETKNVYFEVMTSGQDVCYFYDLLDELTGEEHKRTVYTIIDGFERAGNHAVMIRDIKSIIKEVGAKADANEVFSMMLDGFKGKNLVKMADQEHDLKKYVLIALERMCE